MAHLVRRKTDAAWARSKVVTGADMAFIDANLTAAANGDGGGTYEPDTQCIIAGAGAGISGPWVLEDSVYVQTEGTSVSQIIFGKNTDDDAFIYAEGHEARTKDLLQPFATGNVVPAGRIDAVVVHPILNERAWTQALHAGARIWLQLRVHDTSTLEYVRFYFRVPHSRGAQPPELASRFRVVRVDQNGVIEPMRPRGVDTDEEGFTGPQPASGTAWYAGGAVQSFDYVATQFAEIDASQYVYLAEVFEESGVGDGTYAGTGGDPPENEYITAVARCSNINILANRR